ncbi:hypothetical protein EVAR_93690_1 [Eumeta japonica]|uniref:Uncharacterized protein n=1 Tax=Eumeta variegata TaxID=151549 RepID=A0A4C1U425_EUMVA|nr:hypothetical protein EVAR_93690_1 [Eumeta japonica]
MLTDEFEEGCPKSVVVPQNIDAVWELIMQDRHISYREMKASLGAKVFEEMKTNILHHDNASCNTSAETTQHLEGQENELMA